MASPSATPDKAPKSTASESAKCELALSRSTEYYAAKSKTVHAAVLEVWSGTPFLEVAKKYNQTPDVLATAIAVFGKQAIDIAREKGVVRTRKLLPSLLELVATFGVSCQWRSI